MPTPAMPSRAAARSTQHAQVFLQQRRRAAIRRVRAARRARSSDRGAGGSSFSARGLHRQSRAPAVHHRQSGRGRDCQHAPAGAGAAARGDTCSSSAKSASRSRPFSIWIRCSTRRWNWCARRSATCSSPSACAKRIPTASSLKAPPIAALHNRHVHVGQGIIGWVVENGEILNVPDVTRDERYWPMASLPQTQSELAVPLIFGEEVIGAIDVESDQAGGLQRRGHLHAAHAGRSDCDRHSRSAPVRRRTRTGVDQHGAAASGRSDRARDEPGRSAGHGGAHYAAVVRRRALRRDAGRRRAGQFPHAGRLWRGSAGRVLCAALEARRQPAAGSDLPDVQAD